MDVSVCVTVLNEEHTISDLILGLMTQTKIPDEIVIVDGGSTDRTIKIIKHYQRKYPCIKLIVKKCSRAMGRNMAVTASKNDIIAITDAGCIPKTDWIEKLTKPFKIPNIQVTAGFYVMEGNSSFQKALSIFMGVIPKNFNSKYLPSSRSMAVRKLIFEKLSGFPILQDDTAEDTMFAANLVRQGIKIERVKSALVVWNLPDTIKKASYKFYLYSLGDARSGLWMHPLYGIWSHNVKALLILFRYVFATILLFISFHNPYPLSILMLLILFYVSRSFFKVFSVYKDTKAGLWGIVIQFVSDLSIIAGLVRGLIS